MSAAWVTGWRLAIVVAGLGGATCAAPGSMGNGGGRARLSRPIVEFPTQESLSRIESQPAAPPEIKTGEVPSGGWKLSSLDVAGDPYQPLQPANAWETAFVTDASEQRPRVRLTRAMSCVAREIARFVIETHAPPPVDLQQFLIAACGAVVPTVGSYWLSAEVPARTSDDQLLAQWRTQIKNDLLSHLPGDATDAGFWYGRQRGRAVAILTYTTTHVRWKTLTMVPDAQGNATLEGEIDGAAEYIIAYANQGRFAVATCTVDPSVARPRFRATCPMHKDDTTSWIQLLSAPPKRVLASPFAQILLRRTADQPLVFDPQSYSQAHPVASSGEFSNAVVAALNTVRAQAALPPVQLSLTESARATRLAGHFFSENMGKSGGSDASDRIALGLLAGWQLEGLIRDGHFTASLTAHTHDAGVWLNNALTSPLGRVTLMSPDVEAISLGTVVMDKPDALGAVVTGYRLYHGDDHSADVKRLYARLLAARKRLGLGMPSRLGGMDNVLRTELDRVKSGLRGSSQALEAALDQGVHRFGAGMRGYVIETTSLEAFEIPEAVIKRPNLYFEIGVGHYRAPGAAWGQMVILVVFADQSGGGEGQEI